MSQLPFYHLTLLLIPFLQNLRSSNQPNPVCALLLLGSSHRCKATYETLHASMPDLGLEGGHTRLERLNAYLLLLVI